MNLKTIGNIEVSKEEIGQGSDGLTVGYFKALNKENENWQVLIKRLLRDHQFLAEREMKILLKLESHSNIVRYFGSADSEDFSYLTIERCWIYLCQFIEIEQEDDVGYDFWNIITDKPSPLLINLV